MIAPATMSAAEKIHCIAIAIMGPVRRSPTGQLRDIIFSTR